MYEGDIMCTLFIDTHSSLITVALKKGNDLFKQEKKVKLVILYILYL